MTPVIVSPGSGPVVIGLPHAGTWLPDPVLARLNARGRALADTDWHIDRLYEGLLDGATLVRATVHRYGIDANRDPTGQSLYPGQNTTSLVPMVDFDGRLIWDAPPDPAEVAARSAAWHAPYHAALRAALDRARARHGVAILWEAHSIRSHLPFLFDGRLPAFNIGTNDGTTCAPELTRAVQEICTESEDCETVLNARFKGGWSTRAYGRPTEGIHAIQMELAQRLYLRSEAAPWTYDPAKARPLRAMLARMLAALAALAPDLKGGTHD